MLLVLPKIQAGIGMLQGKRMERDCDAAGTADKEETVRTERNCILLNTFLPLVKTIFPSST